VAGVIVDFLTTNDKIIAVILGSLLLVIGYFYRSLKENKKNLKVALYLLLEIWFRLSIFYKKNFDGLFDQVFKQMREEFPGQDIPQEQVEAAKQYFGPLLTQVLIENMFSDLSSLENKYADAVSLIASSSPLFAYKVAAASRTKKFLSTVDTYLTCVNGVIEKEEGLNKETFKPLNAYVTECAQLDAVKDLEMFIKGLSFRVSFITYISCLFTIRKRRNKIINEGFDKKVMKDLIINGIAPILNGLTQPPVKNDPLI